MKRIVPMPDGTYIECEGVNRSDAWVVSTWQSNGVLERSARPVIQWTEVGEVPRPWTDEERLQALFDNYWDEPEKLKRMLMDLNDEIEERKLRALRSAARRAKTLCRRVIISENFDELLTLTYRENQEDRDLCKAHFKEWCRRMKLALGHKVTFVDRQGKWRSKVVPGDFRFCASFERQERGAMHVHCATHRLPKHALHKGVKIKAWEVGTRIWRDIVGADNGMCFVGGKTMWGGAKRRKKMGLAKMAAYVSKYIMKDFEDAPAESNRYSRSNGIEVPKPTKIELYHCNMQDLITLTFEQGEGDVVIAHRVSKWGDGLWFCTEASLDGLLSSP